MGSTNSTTWKFLEERWAKGFDTLLEEEREAIALWWLEAETFNGTLDQFFFNSSGGLAPLALAGLENLGMTITRDALQSAMRYFGEPYPVDRAARWAALDEIERRHGADVFIPMTRVIQDLPERFVEDGPPRKNLQGTAMDFVSASSGSAPPTERKCSSGVREHL